MIIVVIMVLWMVVGYSFVFMLGNGFIGGLLCVFLYGMNYIKGDKVMMLMVSYFVMMILELVYFVY